jgi:hypothetical protein
VNIEPVIRHNKRNSSDQRRAGKGEPKTGILKFENDEIKALASHKKFKFFSALASHHMVHREGESRSRG